MPARYSIYYAPPTGSALACAAERWFAEADPAITGAPRHYGFHATLKPPFALAEGVTPEDVEAALERFAWRESPFPLPRLEVGVLGDFVALLPAARHEELQRIADACVTEFERFRRPLTEKETAARRAGLTLRQRELLARWGYPHVFDEWRFHLTLTGRIADRRREVAA